MIIFSDSRDPNALKNPDVEYYSVHAHIRVARSK